MNDYKVMERPYTAEEIRAHVDEVGTISGIVSIELSDIIDNDLEGFLNILSEKLIDSLRLMDINYKIVGHEGDTALHIAVDGLVEIEDDNLD